MPLFIKDVAEATLRRKKDDFVVVAGATQDSSISQSVEEEIIKGGIGNSPQYTIRSGKEMEITIKNALFDHQWLAASQGVKVVEGQKVMVMHTEVVEVGEGGKLTIKEKSITEATIVDTYGKNLEATFASGEATVAGLDKQVGKDVSVVYDIEKTGETIAFRGDRFAEKFKLQLFTYAYDQATESIAKEVYITFENVSPSSEFEISLSAGEAFTPEYTLKATQDPKTKEIGKFILVDFVDDEDEEEGK
ncbi:hypothetical protein [Mammaliicoccus lentus]|uniref:hypothetical protein n=1 Tax=Mammaliicoccus lentus TaxID=42858 RepID=UPI001071F189|nr:hypothetical protein [Mammaliicoccus lentus]MBF0793424.1 hypothetical protein [Mammaliicoccus lentus]TFV17921.1 hypothetical protein E4T78_02065 [Mammaliicoccus lentus]